MLNHASKASDNKIEAGGRACTHAHAHTSHQDAAKKIASIKGLFGSLLCWFKCERPRASLHTRTRTHTRMCRRLLTHAYTIQTSARNQISPHKSARRLIPSQRANSGRQSLDGLRARARACVIETGAGGNNRGHRPSARPIANRSAPILSLVYVVVVVVGKGLPLSFASRRASERASERKISATTARARTPIVITTHRYALICPR